MKNNERKVIFAGILGNALELYDYTVYAFFASILAAKFFPSSDPLASLMATLGVYASGFLLRPFGALLIGMIGDRFGRKRALEISIVLMAGPTICMGLLPTYESAGLLAPLLLTFMRLLQGVSVGGEIIGSYTYLVEHADERSKGYFGTWCLVGGLAGKWIGSFTAATMTLLMTPHILEEWGWRIPFLASLLFTAAGYYIRRRVSETPVFKALKDSRQLVKSPIKETFLIAKLDILKCIACFALHTTVMQMIFTYFPVYFKSILGFTYRDALLSNLLGLTSCMIIIPLSGILSDRFGRKKILLSGAVALTLIAYPAFAAIASGDVIQAMSIHLLLAIVFGFMHAPFPAMIMELFPGPIRFTAAALAYNLSVGIFGALTPLMSTWLISMMDTPAAPAVWMIGTGLLSIIATWSLDETYTLSLETA